MSEIHPKPDAETLLLEALDLPPDARHGFLARRCGTDLELLREAKRLLARVEAADGWLDTLDRRLEGWIDNGVENLPEAGHPARPPVDRLGPWKLLERLGAGGMGTVWLGQRDDGAFEQMVAIKFLAAGGAGPALTGRFEAERRILARLEHPNIARLLDGGVTDRGLPWLAMERIDGKPIDRWCDENRLRIGDRVQLFRRVCEAVQHAHSKLVVHRDLKPSNILITSSGEVKLLDFGIAKVLDDQTAEAGAPTILTRIGGSPMTPAFASPEQLRGEPVTTASDVYALGVLLYLLLCGRSPRETVGRTTAKLLEEATCGRTEPPSVALFRQSSRNTDPGTQSIARARQSTPERLRRRLSGDLDIIVLKAMHPEPDRRYATVNQLALDLERWAEGLPIAARPDAWTYRAGKFLLRHPAGVAAAVLLPLVVIAGLVVHTQRLEAERDRAQMQAERAEQVTAFLTGLFEGADPAEARGVDLTARELLDRGVDRIDDFEGDLRVKAEIYRTLGQVRSALGDYQAAADLHRRALELRRELFGPESVAAAESLAELGLALHQLGQFGDADEQLHEALRIIRGHPGEVLLMARVLGNYSSLLLTLERHDEAEAMYRQTIELRRLLHGQESAELAQAINNYGVFLHQRGRFTEAEPLFREALEIRRAVLGEDHPHVTTSLSNVAAALTAAGAYAESAELYGEVVALRRRLFGDAHPELAIALHQQGIAYWQQDLLDQAEARWREALKINRRSLGDAHPATARSLNALAAIARRKGDFDLADRLLQETLAAYRAAYGENHANVAIILMNLGSLREDQGNPEEAERLYLESLAMRRITQGERHPEVANPLVKLALLSSASGQTDQARTHAAEALEIRRETYARDHPLVREVEEILDGL